MPLCSRELWVTHHSMDARRDNRVRQPMSTRIPVPISRASLVSGLREARFSNGLRCPHCGDTRVQRWGTFADRQRYRCHGCRRTFSDLTLTPAAYLKKLEKLPAFAGCMAASLSVRRTAVRIGVHPQTAFRWRHRLLSWLAANDPSVVGGWVELHSQVFAHSRKGERHLDRPARHRGLRPGEIFVHRTVRVVAGCDRIGHVISVQLPPSIRQGPRIPSARVLAKALSGQILEGSRLITRERIFAAFVRATPRDGIRHRAADSVIHPDRPPPPLGRRRVDRDSRSHVRSLAHVRTAAAYLRRMRDWLVGFRGVATRYLPNYLVWHRHLDATFRRRFEALALRWPDTPEFVEGRRWKPCWT